MFSVLFDTDRFKKVELEIQSFLNSRDDFLSENTVKSTRAVGDAIQDILAEHCENILGKEVCCNYTAAFARRAMADLAFEDCNGCYYVIDVKTHRESTKFNMPNLTSVERLARFYEDTKNYFVILMVTYDVVGVRAEISKVSFVPIEFLDWGCLTVGALGWGQIQIANSNNVTINPGYSRKKWMLELCDTLLEFYPREIVKAHKRVEYFEEIRAHWQAMPD
ncbi:MAG: hypothetical protein NT018_03990 [Armatimonadetes bacterium]|nr:hypothetical protein [Armatimonadota bacterium]